MTRRIFGAHLLAVFLLLAFAKPSVADEPSRPSNQARKKAHHQEWSRFSYSLGVMGTKTFGATADDSMGGMAMSISPRRNFSLLSDNSSQGTSTQQPAVDPMIMAMISYHPTAPLSIDLMMSSMSQAGLMDPTLGPSLTMPVARHVASVSSLYLSAPVSKMSQDMYKITTATLSSGLTYQVNRLFFVSTAEYSMSWYRETLYDPGQSASSGNTSLGLDGEGTASQPSQTGQGSGDTGGMGGMDMGGMNMSSDQMKVAMMGQREFSHVGLLGGAFYNLTPKIQLHGDGKVTHIQHQFAPPSWQTHATVFDFGYSTGGYMPMATGTMPMGLAVNGTFGLINTSPNIAAPNVPQLTLGVAYGGM